MSLSCPSVAEILADVGFDWLFIDSEHGAMDASEIQSILQVVQNKCPCIVRIPSDDEVFIKKALDVGASGIIVPMVNSAESAQRIVELAKFPPDGRRGVGVARAHGYGMKFAEYMETANDEISVIIQVEHIDAVHNIESIVKVPGLDAVIIGPYDLSGSIGKPGQVMDDEVQKHIKKVFDVCNATDMPLGIFGINAEMAQPFIEQGFSLVVVGIDTLYLATAAEATLGKLRKSAV